MKLSAEKIGGKLKKNGHNNSGRDNSLGFLEQLKQRSNIVDTEEETPEEYAARKEHVKSIEEDL